MTAPLPLRRKLSDGRLLEGRAVGVYIPQRRRERHFADCFSVCLALAKRLPEAGRQYAWDQGPELAKLVPEGVDRIASPPPGRKRLAAGYYFAGELAAAVVESLRGAGREVRLCRPLCWQQEQIAGAGAAKAIVHQGGQGRKLGQARRVSRRPGRVPGVSRG